MTTITKTIFITGAAAIFAITGMVSAVEARDGQRSGAQKHYGGGDRVGKNRTGHRRKAIAAAIMTVRQGAHCAA